MSFIFWGWSMSRPRYPETTPETALKRAARQLLDRLGIDHFHIQQAMGSFPGIADDVALYRGQTWWLEAKAPTGRQSDGQKNFQEIIERNPGGRYLLYRSIEELIAGMDLPVMC